MHHVWHILCCLLVTELRTYLLGESTKELIQELREDEAYILERFKGREEEQNERVKTCERI